MGCYAAVPGLAAVSDAAVARGKVGAMLCLELPSLHIQPPTGDVEQMVAHALFADAAVAALVSPARSGLELLDVVARTDSANAGMMTWDVTDQGFRMGLSPAIPAVLERHVGDVVRELLEPHGLCPGAVAAWAVHPGGPRILDVIAERVGLEEEDLAESSGVLHDYGNCSSATVLLVLQRILAERALEDGDHVVCMAFGPGLTLYAALLRHRTG
jgi:predicted naringenin-chalcone synthase